MISWFFSGDLAGDSQGDEDPVGHSSYWAARLSCSLANTHCMLSDAHTVDIQERCLLCGQVAHKAP